MLNFQLQVLEKPDKSLQRYAIPVYQPRHANHQSNKKTYKKESFSPNQYADWTIDLIDRHVSSEKNEFLSSISGQKLSKIKFSSNNLNLLKPQPLPIIEKSK